MIHYVNARSLRSRMTPFPRLLASCSLFKPKLHIRLVKMDLGGVYLPFLFVPLPNVATLIFPVFPCLFNRFIEGEF